jgi:hypothetical protein
VAGDVDAPIQFRPVQIDLDRPGGQRAGTATMPPDDPLEVDVTRDLADREWRSTFTNLYDEAVRVRTSVAYTSQDARELHATLLPRRVLEHAAAMAVAAVGLTIHLDGDSSYIDFSDDPPQFQHWRGH